MADMLSIRSTLTHISHVARHLWPRLLAFIFSPIIFILLFALIFDAFAQSTQNASLILTLILVLILVFVPLVIWSWILSGWLRHEFVPDGTPHPQSVGKHLRALCWHQFCAVLVSNLIASVIAIPFMVLGVVLFKTFFKTFIELIISYKIGEFGMHLGSYIILILMSFIPLFIGMVFYLRYSVGALSLVLYGQKMSLGAASAYSTEHEPAGLTRRFAFYMICHFITLGSLMGLIETASGLPPLNADGMAFLFLLGYMVLWLIFVIGIAALISAYLKSMPTPQLQKSS